MAVLRKITPIVIFLVICALVFGGCKQKSPKITTIITLSNITKEEFIKIEKSSKQEGSTSKDFFWCITSDNYLSYSQPYAVP